MAIETWEDDLATLVAAALNADTDLMAVVKKAEVGLIDPVDSQVVLVSECPYLSVSIPGHDSDSGAPRVGFCRFATTVRVAVVVMQASQKAAEATMRKILSHLPVFFGRQKTTTPFGLRSDGVQSVLLDVGRSVFEHSSSESSLFKIGGSHTSTVLCDVRTASS